MRKEKLSDKMEKKGYCNLWEMQMERYKIK